MEQVPRVAGRWGDAKAEVEGGAWALGQHVGWIEAATGVPDPVAVTRTEVRQRKSRRQRARCQASGESPILTPASD